jgi:transposase, IS6 family
MFRRQTTGRRGWIQRFTPLYIDAAQPCRHATDDRWFVDETYVKTAGRRVYLYRAIDQFGRVIDAFAAEKHGLPASRQFFTQALKQVQRPVEVTTDRVSAGLPADTRSALLTAMHVVEQYAK